MLDAINNVFFVYLALILPLISSMMSLITKSRIRLYLNLIMSVMTFICCYNVYLRYIDIQGIFLVRNLAKNFSIFMKPDLYGAIFALLISFMWFPSILFSHVYMYYHCNKDEKIISEFLSYFSIAISVTIAISFSGNLLTLLIFYEVLTIVTYFLVTFDKTDISMKAGRIYIITLMGSSIIFLMPAVIFLWLEKGTSLSFDEDLRLLISDYPFYLYLFLFLFFIYGFAKHALMPLHIWLPKAMVAPTPVSALLHAVAVVKSGIFGVIKVNQYVFTPFAQNINMNTRISDISNVFSIDNSLCILNMKFGFVIQAIATFTIIVASMIAITKKQLKEVLAYSTISQLGYMLFVIGMMNKDSIKTTFIYMILHSFSKITLFFTVGAIYIRTHKKYIDDVNGLFYTMPLTCIFFTIGVFAMIGLPLTGNNYGKAFIIGATNGDIQTYFAIIVMGISTMLNTLYFLPIVYRMLFCVPKCVDEMVGTRNNVNQCHECHSNVMNIIMNSSFIITGLIVVFLFFRIDILENLVQISL